MTIVADDADKDNFFREADNNPARQRRPMRVIDQALHDLRQQPADDANVTDFLKRAGQLSRSGEEWGTIVPLGAPRFSPDYPATLLGTLPRWFSEFATAAAVQVQTAAALSATMGLAAASAMIAGRVDLLYRNGGHPVTANIYAAVLMTPGSRKSAITKIMRRPIEELETRERARHALDEPAAKARAKLAAKRAEKAEKDAINGKLSDDEAIAAMAAATAAADAVPPRPQRLWDDLTPEAAAKGLDEHGRIASLQDESGVLDAGRYSAAGTENIDVWLKGWDGATLRVNRKVGAEYDIPRAMVTMGLSTQPEKFQRFIADERNVSRGYVQRWIIVAPQTWPGYEERRPAAIGAAVQAAYARGIQWLDHVGGTIRVDDDGATAAAAALLDRWEAEIQQQQRYGGIYHIDSAGRLPTDFGAKLMGTTLRLVAIATAMWACERDEGLDAGQWSASTIDAGVQAGIALAQYYAAATLGAYRYAQTPFAQSDAERIWAEIRKLPDSTWTRRDLHSRVKRIFIGGALQLAELLDVLEDFGYIRTLDGLPRGTKGGRPSLRYETNPAALHGEAAQQPAVGARWDEPAPPTVAAQWAAELQQPAVAAEPTQPAVAAEPTLPTQPTAEPGTAAGDPAQRRPRSREIASGIPGIRVHEVDHLGLGFTTQPTAEPGAAPDGAEREWLAATVEARIRAVAADDAQWRPVTGSTTPTLQAYVPMPGSIGTIRLWQVGGGYILHGGSGSTWADRLGMVPNIDDAAAAAAAAVTSGSIW